MNVHQLMRILLVSLSFLVFGCSFSFQNWQYQKGVRLSEKHQFKEAADLFSRVVRRGPDAPIALEAARRGSKIAAFDVKNYSLAGEFYRHLVMHSADKAERLEAQRALVDVYFDKVLNYEQAVIEISHLQPLLPDTEKGRYQLLLARAHFNLNNLPQSLVEINDLIGKKISPDLKFEALLFKANLLQGSKKLNEAVVVFEEIEKTYPALAREANVGMSMAICYEEQGELGKAVKVLENLKDHHANPEFIQIRITKLKDRMANLPGAQGLKR